MKKYPYLFFFFFMISLGCFTPIEKKSSAPANLAILPNKTTENYELHLPVKDPIGVLILFPGFPETPERVKTEFKIMGPALRKGIAVAFMKFNQRLWLNTTEKFRLSKVVNQLFHENNLVDDRLFIGGFSSGGNISILLANHLAETQNIIQPKGVFIVDSPVDLLGLYEISQRNIQRNFSKISIRESKNTINRFDTSLGKPENGIENYELHAPYTLKTNNISNLAHLDGIKIRFYTEPDVDWWQKNRQNDYEDMNAYYIKHLANELTKKYGKFIEYLPTENKGYRANGQRHPHAWSIVNVDDLTNWMLQ